MGLPDLRGKKQKGKQKAPKDRTHVAETLDKLRQQTRETVKGLESVTGGDDFDSSAMMEDWVKQFEELAGSQVLSIFLIHMGSNLFAKTQLPCSFVHDGAQVFLFHIGVRTTFV